MQLSMRNIKIKVAKSDMGGVKILVFSYLQFIFTCKYNNKSISSLINYKLGIDRVPKSS